MLVSAAAGMWKVEPSSCRAAKGQVVHVPTARKLSYGALAALAAKQPVPVNVALKDSKDFRLIGTPAKRIDTPAKLDGSAVFGIDVRLPGMKVATVTACPLIGGRVADVDDTKARAVSGVVQIVRLEKAVAVVADHMGAAKKGLAALSVKWEPGPGGLFSSAQLLEHMKVAATRSGAIGKKEGDAEGVIAAAPKRLEAVYELPFLAHATMEPMNCTVHVRKDSCEVWVGNQVLARAQAAAAEASGLPPEKVTVHNHFLGGGFGRRLEVDYVSQAVAIAKQLEFPLKVIWTREEDTQHDIYRPYYYDRLAAALDDKGLPTAFSHRIVGSSIVARWLPPLFKDDLDFDAIEGAAGVYAFPNVLVDYVREEPPPGLWTGWWRGVGATHNAFMVEGFVDELAAAAGKDPVEYRRALLDLGPARARRAPSGRREGRMEEAAARGHRTRHFRRLRLRHLRRAGGGGVRRQGRRGQGVPWSARSTAARRSIRTRSGRRWRAVYGDTRPRRSNWGARPTLFMVSQTRAGTHALQVERSAPGAWAYANYAGEDSCEMALICKPAQRAHLQQRQSTIAQLLLGCPDAMRQKPFVRCDSHRAAKRMREMTDRQSAFLRHLPEQYASMKACAENVFGAPHLPSR
jgi:CO/xanthine dehydrogenase Mo-binding subunit